MERLIGKDGKWNIGIDKASFDNSKPWRFISRFGIYITAAVLVLLNFVRIFDRVAWGDEAFAINAARLDMKGLFQVMYYGENHPPLYYLILKLCFAIFGDSIPVAHFSELLSYLVCTVIILTFVRKHLGKCASYFCLLIMSLGMDALTYNVEIRMYSVAFLCIFGCSICAYKVIKGEQKAWIPMTLWAIGASYSHYFALALCGLMLVVTALFGAMRSGRKTFVNGIIAVLAMMAGFIPWYRYLFYQMKYVNGHFWIEEASSIKDIVKMLLGGERIWKLILVFFLIGAFLIKLIRFGFVRVFRGNDGTEDIRISARGEHVRISAVLKSRLSDKEMTAFVLFVSLLLCVAFGYGYSLIIRPIFIARYAYPMSAAVIFAASLLISDIKDMADASGLKAFNVKLIWGAVCAAMLICIAVMGFKNYKDAKVEFDLQKSMTEDVLTTIGTPDEDTIMAALNVPHMAWSVLECYYPDNEIESGWYFEHDWEKYWYFIDESIGSDGIAQMESRGYEVRDCGYKMIAKYPCYLYYFEKK